MEDEIDNNLDALHGAAKRLNKLGSAVCYNTCLLKMGKLTASRWAKRLKHKTNTCSASAAKLMMCLMRLL